MINYFWVSIKGKSSKKILNNILNENINIISIKYKHDEILIKLSYDDYKKLNSIRACDMKIVKTSGKKKIHEDIIKYKITIISFVLSMLLIIFLSFHIFYIKIDTNNMELKKEIEDKLKDEGITIFSRKRSHKRLNEIRTNIKNNSSDIEWIEFDNDGVVLNVKVIEKIEKYSGNNIEREPTDIVAKRSGYIRKIEATSGDVLKNIDDYVNQGEVIISGNIVKNDEIVAKTRANGLVYAEVWYINKYSRNNTYMSLYETNKSRYKVVLKIKDKPFNILNIKIPKTKDKRLNIFNNKLFFLYTEKKREYKKIKRTYTDREVIFSIKSKAKNDILKTLDKNEYIIEEKTLKKYKENGKITIEVLFKVYEEIGQKTKAKEFIEKEEE